MALKLRIQQSSTGQRKEREAGGGRGRGADGRVGVCEKEPVVMTRFVVERISNTQESLTSMHDFICGEEAVLALGNELIPAPERIWCSASRAK